MKNDTGTSINCPFYAKDIIDNIRCTRRSKVNGKSIDKEQLTQPETLLLLTYFFVENNTIYKELLSFSFDRDLINKLKLEYKRNV